MAKLLRTSVQFHSASGRFCKMIGRAVGRDGLPRPKLFYFGDDEREAQQQAARLKARWQLLQAAGATLWDEDDFRQAEDGRMPVKPVPAIRTPEVVTVPAVDAPVPSVLTLGQAVRDYVARLQRQSDSGQFTQRHVNMTQARLERTLSQADARIPLSQVNDSAVAAVVTHWCSRPKISFRQPGAKKKTSRRMSVIYAKQINEAFKAFLNWCHESSLWDKPRSFDRLFKQKPVLTEDERIAALDGSEVDHFTRDELVKLYHAANDHQRLLVTLGLNCAYCAAEIASLKASEVKHDDTVIERYRRKTLKTCGRGAYGKWHLWRETSQLLQQHKARKNRDGLYLLTEHGKPLDKNTSVAQSWRRLVNTAQVRPLSHKYLRKTAAHLIRNELGFGRDVADMMLSHTDSGVIRFYAGRDWSKLKTATEAMREYLSPMFDKQTAVNPDEVVTGRQQAA